MASARFPKSVHHRRDIFSHTSESHGTADNDRERDGSSTQSPRCLESINEDLLKRRLKGTLFSPGEHRGQPDAAATAHARCAARWLVRMRWLRRQAGGRCSKATPIRFSLRQTM
jgi:hypothetical protein